MQKQKGRHKILVQMPSIIKKQIVDLKRNKTKSYNQIPENDREKK